MASAGTVSVHRLSANPGGWKSRSYSGQTGSGSPVGVAVFMSSLTNVLALA